MARKTAYESNHIKLKNSNKNDKNTKQRAWQYLFENRDKAFSATHIGKILEVHRTTVKEALEKLIDDKPIIEKSKEYKVYRVGTSYRIFDNESYNKYIAEQQKGTTISNRIIVEVDKINNPKMWASDKAELVPAIVVFYPMTKNKTYFNTVKISLIRLFNEYIINTLEGKKNGIDGLYIILKNQEGIDKIKDSIMELYEQAALQRTKFQTLRRYRR